MAASSRVRLAKAAVAAVALAVAVAGEPSVGKALSEAGLQRNTAERPTALRMAPAAATRDFRRAPLVADVAQRAALAGLPAVLAPDGAGIDVGYPDARTVLTLFEDFRCTTTAAFEAAQGRTLADLAARHVVLIRYVMESSLDQRLPGPGALRATNAARSALSRGRFPLYHALLFANQPDESVDGFTDDRLLQIADQVPGLRDDSFDAEVHSLWNRGWVNRAQAAYTKAHVHHGTPSMLVNGHEVDLGAQPWLITNPLALTDLIERSARPLAKPASAKPKPAKAAPAKPKPAKHKH